MDIVVFACCCHITLHIPRQSDLYLIGVVFFFLFFFFLFFFSFLLSLSLLIGRHFPDIHPPNLAYSGGEFVRRLWLIIGKTPKIRLAMCGFIYFRLD